MTLLRWIPSGSAAAARRLALASLAVVTLLGCATNQPIPTDGWTRENVSGITLALHDPMREEWLRFSEDGDVTATIGQVHNYADVNLHWRIVRGRLRIFDGNTIYEDLTFVSRDKSTILARRSNGHLANYRVLRN